MNPYIRQAHWLLVGSWLLMTPPTPLGTSLPPVSQWSQVSTHASAAECESNREKMRSAARRTVAGDPNAHALQVAAALGQLQSRCIESRPAAPAAPEQAATPPPANPPIANPPVANPPAKAEPEPVTDQPAPKR
jgi:hypothetical protein